MRTVQIDPRALRVPARAAVAFKPLEMIDPRTGKAVTPDTMLTLDNRRQITAAKYYEQMNQLEAGINKLGHSFRDQQRGVVTAEVVQNTERTLAQIRSMRSSPSNPRTAARLETITQAHRDYVRTVNPNFGKLGREGFSRRVTNGLYEQKVGVYDIAKRAAPGSLTLQRPDLLPGDSEVVRIDNQIEFVPGINGDPGWADGEKRATAIQVNASWPRVAFYVNYVEGSFKKPKATAPLAAKYVWQVAKTNSSLNNFGSFAKAWATEFDEQELVNWQTSPGLIASGNVGFLSGSEQKEHLFEIDFGQLLGTPKDRVLSYVVRVIPVNADGSIAGYPSRPVLVSYGTHPELQIPVKIPASPPVIIPVNNIDQQAPASFGDPSVMSLKLNTWVKSNGSPVHQSASVGFDAECSVFGVPYPLVTFSADAEISPGEVDTFSDGVVTSGVHIQLAGIEVPCETCTQKSPKALSYKIDYTEPVKGEFKLSFPVGPIDVSATVGIVGEVGVGGYVHAYAHPRRPSLEMSAGPHLSVRVYIEAGVGIGAGGYDVVQVGVRGDMNLISAGFVVGLSVDSKVRYFGRVSELNVLNGRLYGFAKGGICPFCKTWTTNLVNWSGYDLLATDPGKATLFEGSF